MENLLKEHGDEKKEEKHACKKCGIWLPNQELKDHELAHEFEAIEN